MRQSLTVERLQARLGAAVETHTETLSFADENPVGRLQQIAMANPGKAIYLTGTLTADYPEGIVLQAGGRQYETVVLSGETLTVELHPLEVGVLQLGEQWVVGNLAVMLQRTISKERVVSIGS